MVYALVKVAGGKTAKVDLEDYDRVAGYTWYLTTPRKDCCTVYAKAHVPGNNRKHVWMHRLVLNALPGSEVDHCNRDGLDNRKENLRFCSHMENQGNRHRKQRGSSQFKGVGWVPTKNRWQAQIQVRGRKQHLGFFRDEKDAARAYDVAALAGFKEFAVLNFA